MERVKYFYSLANWRTIANMAAVTAFPKRNERWRVNNVAEWQNGAPHQTQPESWRDWPWHRCAGNVGCVEGPKCVVARRERPRK